MGPSSATTPLSQALVADYRAGQSTRQLMATYGLGKGAVLRLLEAAGVQTRHQGLTSADQTAAAKLYAAGWSAAKVATKMGYSPTQSSVTPAQPVYRSAHGRVDTGNSQPDCSGSSAMTVDSDCT